MRALTVMAAAMCIINGARSEAMAQSKPIKALTVGLMETTRDFIAANNVASKFANVRDGGSAFFEVHLGDKEFSRLQLHYRSDGCAYDFPPGRWTDVGQTAARIDLLTSFMPLQTLGFEDGLALADQIREGLHGAGWREIEWRTRPTRENLDDNPFARSEIELGVWAVCGNADQKASLSIKHAGQTVVGTSVPLEAQVRKSPVQAGGEFLLVLDVSTSREERLVLTNLAAARRLRVNGDQNKELMAKVWIDDPDWRPPQ